MNNLNHSDGPKCLELANHPLIEERSVISLFNYCPNRLDIPTNVQFSFILFGCFVRKLLRLICETSYLDDRNKQL